MATRTPSRPLVLVVDDEPGILDFLRYALEDKGYRVAIAHDGREALDSLADERPDFILTDLMMPRLNGWDLCRELRANPETRTIPLLGMSAVESSADLFDSFMRKPFEFQDLLTRLERLRTAGTDDGWHGDNGATERRR